MPGLTTHWAPVWDVKASEPDGHSVGRSNYSDEAWAVLAASAIEMLQLHGTDTLVDVGCGTGRLGEMLRPSVARYVGLDFSLLQLKNGRGPRARADAGRMPLSDGSADAVLLSGVVGSLSHEECGAALAEARRVVRPGGRCAVTGVLMRMVWLLTMTKESPVSPQHQTMYYPEELCGLAGSVGWSSAKVYAISQVLPQWAIYFDVVFS